MVIALSNTFASNLSSRKLARRDTAKPPIAPAKCPSKLPPTRGSSTTVIGPLFIRPGLRRATARWPAMRPISCGVIKSAK